MPYEIEDELLNGPEQSGSLRMYLYSRPQCTNLYTSNLAGGKTWLDLLTGQNRMNG